MYKRSKHNQSGQVALVILLIMVVILTIGLSLAARSITDIRISQDEKEAVRVFSAAEAGIEEVLHNVSLYAGQTQSVPVEGDLQAQVTVASVYDITVDKGEPFTVDLTMPNVGAGVHNLDIYWTKTDDSEENQGGCTNNGPAAMEIIVYKSDNSFTRYVYDASGCTFSNDFQNSSAGSDGYLSKASFNVNPTGTPADQLIRMRTFYRKASLRVVSDQNLGDQIYRITSEASSADNKVGKIIVDRTIAVVPGIFDYVLFSGGNLSN